MRHVDAVLGEPVLNIFNNYGSQKKNLTIEGKYVRLTTKFRTKPIDSRE